MCQASLFVLLASALGTAHGFVGSKAPASLSSTCASRRKTHDTRRFVATSPFVEPQANPNAVEDNKSLSGVSLQAVLEGLEQLYPPQDLQLRNAASRTDGYWKYISQGQEPPMDLTYGEFDFHFFAQVMDRAHHHYYHGGGGGSDPSTPPSSSTWNDKVMMDIGSGTGRLVLGAAALYPEWKECRGVELLQGIHDVAVDRLDECNVAGTTKCLPSVNTYLPMAPVKLSCGSFEDPTMRLGDVDCAFAFSSCFTPNLMERLGQAVGRQCKPGSIIITTDYMLPLVNSIPPIDEDYRTGTYRLELAEKMDGWCWLTGGASTVYIHRVVDSLASV